MSALTAPTKVTREKRERKETNKKTPTNDRKPKKGKEQDHLKKISLGPLRQGQWLDTSETKQCSSKEHKSPTKA
jgi:ribosomal protein L14E/L6E/L27E